LCWGKHGCPESVDSLQELGDQTRIVFKHKNVICNGKDVTDEIRTELISSLASKISSFSSIREVMKKQQRTLVEEVRKSESYLGAVLEGRDIGTVVFPDAEFKFYVDASPEIRAKRRMLQLQERGENVNFEKILTALRKRDFQDQNRKVAPLRPAEDALIVDTGNLSADQVLEHLVACIGEEKNVS
jgi:cytidylate kinase